MASSLSAGDILTYNYIKNLYYKLNNARSKFSFNSVTLTKQLHDIHTATDITTLEDYLVTMKSNRYLSSMDMSSIQGANRPIQNQTLIRPYDFNSIETIIDQILATNAYDADYADYSDHSDHSDNSNDVIWPNNGNNGNFIWGSDSGATNSF